MTRSILLLCFVLTGCGDSNKDLANATCNDPGKPLKSDEQCRACCKSTISTEEFTGKLEGGKCACAKK